MNLPRVFVDFQNATPDGFVRLTCRGTLKDLGHQGIRLVEGLQLLLYSDDLDEQGRDDELRVEGKVGFSEKDHCWVAAIDWNAIRHASDDAQRNGAAAPTLTKEATETP
jgi:hypothetical protein